MYKLYRRAHAANVESTVVRFWNGVREKPRLEEREKRVLRTLAGYEMLERNKCATTSIIQLKAPFHIGGNGRHCDQS
jgi:hypothetical protein